MRLANVTCKKVEDYLKKSDTVIIAVGSIENHGRQNPLGVDTMIPDKILELLEEKSDVMIAPTIPYGDADDLVGAPGTISIGVDGLTIILRKVCECLYNDGFRRFIILNGHGPNGKAIGIVGEELYAKGALLANMNWWLMAGELNPEWVGGHGGAVETAGVMAVDPSLVDYDYINDGMDLSNDISDELPTNGFSRVTFQGATVVFPRPVSAYSGNGWIGPDHPNKATVEWGNKMVQMMADYIADFVPVFERANLPKV